MRKYTWKMIFRDFRYAYPELWRSGTVFSPHGFMSILVSIPGRGKLVYEYFGDKITWLEEWEDEKEIKQKEKEMRPKTYGYFVFIVNEYMKKFGYTQQDIADISGVSRISINKYLTGRSVPKTSTMKKICDSLGIDI